MGKDDGLKEFFSDDERYADVVNGLGFGGRQVIRKGDLQDLDTQTGVWRSPRFIKKQYPRQKKRIKYRDAVRKIAMGMNFAVVGIENQDEIDYSMVLRNMVYDVDEYERQASKIRKEIRKNRDGLSRGEYIKNAPAFLLRGMHRLCRYHSFACLCNPAGGYIRWESSLI